MYNVDVVCQELGYLLINKAPNVIVQGNGKGLLPELYEVMNVFKPGYFNAHRIDKMTSGLLLFAKRPYLGYFQSKWANITRKTYLAIVKTPKWSEAVTDAKVDGLSAKTGFHVLESKNGLSVLECKMLQNGRKHQIRRHLAGLGHPILGDTMYGGAKSSIRNGQHLHAWKLELLLPKETRPNWLVPGNWRLFQAPVPDDFLKYDFDWAKINSGPVCYTLETIRMPETWTRVQKTPVPSMEPALVAA